MSDAEAWRVSRLNDAGWNVLNLDASDVEHDLFTDVPTVATAATVAAAGAEACGTLVRSDRLGELAAELYGPARYIAAAKGRSAESALAAAMVRPGTVALTHGLFRTTRRALVERGATVEELPIAAHGSSDMDLAAVEQRLARGGVSIVYVEPANNAWCGWPLSRAHVEALALACRNHGARLVIDATRVLSNGVLLGESPLESARALLACADAFTVSAAKELFVPVGSLVAVRDLELERAVFLHAFEEGTLLEPLASRRMLAEGMRAILASPAPIARRAARVRELARLLRERAVPFVEPVSAHGVWIDGTALGATTRARHLALQAHLYRVAGVRSLIHPHAGLQRPLLRLALAVRGETDDADLVRIADGTRAFFDRAAEAVELVEVPHEAVHAGFFARYAPRA